MLIAHGLCAHTADARSAVMDGLALALLLHFLQLYERRRAERQVRTPELCANPAPPSQPAVSTLRSQQRWKLRGSLFCVELFRTLSSESKATLEFCNY